MRKFVKFLALAFALVLVCQPIGASAFDLYCFEKNDTKYTFYVLKEGREVIDPTTQHHTVGQNTNWYNYYDNAYGKQNKNGNLNEGAIGSDDVENYLASLNVCVPGTDTINWYVLKWEKDGWHVDGVVKGSKEEEEIFTPTPEVTPEPTPITTPDPTPVITEAPVEKPTPIVTEAPVPEVTTAPAITVTPIVTEEPTPIVTETPVVTENPTPIITETPVITPSPVVEIVTPTPTPVVEIVVTPTPEVVEIVIPSPIPTVEPIQEIEEVIEEIVPEPSEEVIEIPEEIDTPEGTPDAEVEEVAPAEPVEEVIEIEEPENPEGLPQTGMVNSHVFYLIGLFTMMGGFVLIKKSL